jgi:hypothetical protein
MNAFMHCSNSVQIDDAVKRTVREVVMLPLQRPELFRGLLAAPCKGVLLFGPPGTHTPHIVTLLLVMHLEYTLPNESMSTLQTYSYGSINYVLCHLCTSASSSTVH